MRADIVNNCCRISELAKSVRPALAEISAGLYTEGFPEDTETRPTGVQPAEAGRMHASVRSLGVGRLIHNLGIWQSDRLRWRKRHWHFRRSYSRKNHFNPGEQQHRHRDHLAVQRKSRDRCRRRHHHAPHRLFFQQSLGTELRSVSRWPCLRRQMGHVGPGLYPTRRGSDPGHRDWQWRRQCAGCGLRPPAYRYDHADRDQSPHSAARLHHSGPGSRHPELS